MRKKNRWLQTFGIMLLPVAIAVIMASQILAQPPKPLPITHPLEPLTAAEITTAVTVLKKEKALSDRVVFPNLSLRDPDKAKVLAFKIGNPIQREAFVVVLEPAKNKTYEAIVDLKKASILSWKEVSGGQPALVDDDYVILSTLAKADPRWQAAMKKRGITDLESSVVDGWAMGLMSEQEKALGKRLMRGVTYYKDKKRMNYYGSPVEGLSITVDLNNKKVVEVIDRGVQPISKANFDYDAASQKPLQPALKPLEIKQPKGASFKLNKNEVTWQNWKFRFLMHPREGLTLYQVSYNDKGKVRPILYRAGLSEMVVPYADTSPSWYVRSAFDVGEYRFGWLSTTLNRGKDVPENALLLDALFADDLGSPAVSKDLIAIYEKDAGILWRHYDSNTETYEGHRSRELVLTTVAAIGNYDYGINWVFHEDGTLEVQTDLTGIMLVKGTKSITENHDHDQFGHLVAPNVLAINHQHFANFRLDFDVDGTANRVTEMKVSALPKSESNPQSNAFKMEEIPLATESKAVRDMNLAESRSWMIENATKKNALGGAISYMLMPGGNTVFYPLADSNVRHRGQFANHHLWVTQYKPEELYAAGDYPNQGLPEQGLPQWVADNESLEGKDLVVWYTMGVTHIPRPEEWPIMTVHRASFKIMSRGFFTQNPVLNVSDAEVSKK
jgi:primary-amine oxidase